MHDASCIINVIHCNSLIKMTNTLYNADALDVLIKLSDESVDLIYTDPPFNTGDVQVSKRTGLSYSDKHDDYISWMHAWVSECHRVLKKNGTMYLHLDDHNVHKARCFVMDKIFKEQNY